MATTTKSKAKSKTTKSKTAAKRPAAVKANRKSVSTKVVRTPVGKTIQPASSLIGQIQLLHLISAGAGVILAVATVLLAKAYIVPVTISYTAQNSLLSGSGAVFAPAERVWYEIDVRWFAVALFISFAAYSALILTRWQQSYQKALAGRIYLWRWVEFGLVGALLVKVAAMLSGVHSELVLKGLVGLVLAGAGFAWLSEVQNEKTAKVRSAHALSALGLLLPWVIIGASLWATAVYGLIRLPWYAYAVTVLGLAAFTGSHINQWLQHRRSGQWADYAFAERNHVLGSLLVKVALGVILVVGLK